MARSINHVSATLDAGSRVRAVDREHPSDGVPRMTVLVVDDLSLFVEGTDAERAAALSLLIAAAGQLREACARRVREEQGVWAENELRALAGDR